MNDLSQLKNILKKGRNERDVIFNLCSIMELVGGYEQLMNLPLSTLEPILTYLKEKQELENKKNNQLLGKKR